MKIEETNKCKCKRSINVNASYVNNNNLYTYGRNPRCFTGLIYESDFNTYEKFETKCSQAANKVQKAMRFDDDLDKMYKINKLKGKGEILNV